jgi:SAM-dependent methyltransferase
VVATASGVILPLLHAYGFQGASFVVGFSSLVLSIAARDLSPWLESTYYEDAEDPEYLDVFWGTGTYFRQAFDDLDHRSILEVAAGRGRNAARLLTEYDLASLTVVDAAPGNVAACRARFDGNDRVQVGLIDGATLSDLPSEYFSAVYSYDSMVHFDPLVVLAYLQDIFRVLEPGGKALLHHSNFAANPGGPYGANPHARNFAPYGFFDHCARAIGFTVSSTRTLDWGGIRDLDRLTILQR